MEASATPARVLATRRMAVRRLILSSAAIIFVRSSSQPAIAISFLSRSTRGDLRDVISTKLGKPEVVIRAGYDLIGQVATVWNRILGESAQFWQ